MTRAPHTDPRYRKQQQAIADIARRLNVVVYLPDYHCKRNDPNTVLLYTKEAAAHNREVDKQLTQYSRAEADDLSRAWKQDIDPKYVYQDYFWCFQNTDINGCITLDYGNHGTIDLRSLKWEDALEQAIITALVQYNNKAESKGDD